MPKRFGELVKEIDDLYKEPFTPVCFNNPISQQLDLFGVRENGDAAIQLDLFNPSQSDFTESADHLTLANFYEVMSQGLFGGRRFNQLFVSSSNGQPDEVKNGYAKKGDLVRIVKPDIVDQEHHRMWEIKAFRAGRSCNISDTQMKGYSTILETIPDTTIYFVFYRHTVPGVRTTYRTDDDLLRTLAQSTTHSIVLPFDVVRALHTSPSKQSDFAFRGVNQAGPSTYVRSQVTNYFLADPEDTLSTLGISSNCYFIERFRLPSLFYVGGNEVKNFPILMVRKKNYN